MIDRTTVDRIFEAVRIVDVVGEFVSLKRRGANYIGCCPFHNERTPSFIVSPAKNIYKCFGCGKAGNSVNFVMEHEQLGYPDALRYLAKKYGIPVEERQLTPEEMQQNDHRESLMVVSSYAARVFHDNLFNTLEGTAVGLSYLKERGFREDVIKTFELGYSHESRAAFAQKAMKDGYKEDFLVETGLCIRGERGVFDRFAARVMFPVHSLSGKVVAFGGRVLKSDKKAAKYLNSPESEIYHKSKILYGIFQAKKSMLQNDKCFLVEGYTDVLALHQAGIENVVASSGTALTAEQIQLVKRFTPNITVLYDGDPAGIKASLRGIDLILQEDMNVKVLLLPEGEDPDSFAFSKSATELEEYIRASETDFITFKAQLLLSDAKNDPLKRSQLITDVVQSISLIPKDITRAVYLKECSRMFEIDEQTLAKTAETMRQKRLGRQQTLDIRQQTLDNRQQTPETQPETRNLKPETHPELVNSERELLRLMLLYGGDVMLEVDESTGEIGLTVADYIIREMDADDLTFEHPLMRAVFEEYKQLLLDGETIDNKRFTQHHDPNVSSLAAGFETPKYELSKIHRRNGAVIKTESDNLFEVAPLSVLAYKYERVMLRLKEVECAIRQAETDSDNMQVETLFLQYSELTNVKKELGLTLGERIYTRKTS